MFLITFESWVFIPTSIMSNKTVETIALLFVLISIYSYKQHLNNTAE